MAGAAGQVGEGVVQVLLAEGWDVTALGRNRSRLDDLCDRLGRPTGLWTAVATATVTGWDLPSGLVDGTTLAVASLGGWYSGPPLASLPLDDWNRVLQDGLTAHLHAAQALLPGLESAGGTYVMVNGAAALTPVPGSGAVSVVAAAQLMLAKTLAAESTGATVRSLVLGTPVLTRDRPVGPDGWISAEDVGRAVLRLHDDPGGQTIVSLGQGPV